jgi:ribonuclease-3
MTRQRSHQVKALEGRLGYVFQQVDWVREALTHRSAGSPNNERLEFLGDSVLSLLVTQLLFARYPDWSEGDLSQLRSRLVSRDTLAQIALDLDLGSCLLLGPGEQKGNGASRPSILADALEAVLGALYKDGGLAVAEGMVLRWMTPLLEEVSDPAQEKHPKSQLQEILQARRWNLPDYHLVELRGQDHDQTFQVECHVPEANLRTQAEGKSRRQAEELAARKMIEALELSHGKS